MKHVKHHRVVGLVGAATLLAAVVGQARSALAQPGVAPTPAIVPMPVPTPIVPPAPAPVVAPAAAATIAPSFTTPEINAPSMTAPAATSTANVKPPVDDGETGPKSSSAATGYAALGILSGPVFLGLAIAVGEGGGGGSEGLASALGIVSAFGFIGGPSAGRWYVGEVGGGPLVVRGLGVALMVGGLASQFCWEDCGDNTAGETAVLVGMGLYLGSVVYDLATAGDVARDYNRRHRSTANNLTFAPMVKRSEGSGGSTTAGLMLGGSF